MVNTRITELLKASSRQVDASVGTTSEFGWIPVSSDWLGALPRLPTM